MTKGQSHIPALDGVRGLAVLTVFVYHFGGGAQSPHFLLRITGETIKLGWSGVTLFFVLSGYLITGILWRSYGTEHWWRVFYTRRCLRIFPLYYFSLLVVLFVGLIEHQVRELTPPLTIYALYLQAFPAHITINLNDISSPFMLGHFWSLAVEEHFYLVWPFLLFGMRTCRSARTLCAAVMAVSFGFRAWVAFSGVSGLYSSTPARMGELALGAWLALAVHEAPSWLDRVRRMAVPIVILSMGAAGVCVAITKDFDARTAPMYLFGIPLLSIGYGGLLLLALQNGRVTRFFSFAPLRHLGTISYGVYVYHVFFKRFYEDAVYRSFPHASRNLQLALIFVVAAIFTLLIAEASFRFFERPFLKLKERVAPTGGRRRPVPKSSDGSEEAPAHAKDGDSKVKALAHELTLEE